MLLEHTLISLYPFSLCNKGCSQEIYFDANNKSQSGKYIPLNKDTGLPHQCQTNNDIDLQEESLI